MSGSVNKGHSCVSWWLSVCHGHGQWTGEGKVLHIKKRQKSHIPTMGLTLWRPVTRAPVKWFSWFPCRQVSWTNMDKVESAKRAAAHRAVDEHVKDAFRVGVGSGSTVVYAVERLAQRVKEEGLRVVCVPTSFQSRQLIVNSRLEMTDLETTPVLDVAIDGADEADKQLTLIKGGGGCQLQEKVIAAAAKTFVVIADYRKDSTVLGEKWVKGIPIEVIPLAYCPIKLKIESELGGQAILRQAKAKAGPVVTDNGNFILDWVFDKTHDWNEVNQQIMMIPGVVETGLFVGMASVAYFGMQDGSVKERHV